MKWISITSIRIRALGKLHLHFGCGQQNSMDPESSSRVCPKYVDIFSVFPYRYNTVFYITWEILSLSHSCSILVMTLVFLNHSSHGPPALPHSLSFLEWKPAHLFFPPAGCSPLELLAFNMTWTPDPPPGTRHLSQLLLHHSECWRWALKISKVLIHLPPNIYNT